ncbi:MAG: ribosome maturation factor RimP [Epsilonproteobacteria bacterium]|nr:ribosome maturation factor RimP [Campylobacterota bacterium]
MNIEDEIKAVVESAGSNLYDIQTLNENGETIYRVSIVGDDGKTDLNQCVEITHLLSPLLDVNPPISGEYRLEVSSPGVERKIKHPHQYKLSIGENVELKLFSTERVKGKLVDFKDDTITLETEFGKEEFKLDDISSAKTYFEW